MKTENQATDLQRQEHFLGCYPEEEQALASPRLVILLLGSLLLESSVQRQMQQALKFGILCEG
jgi:hypothetical protein